MLTGLQRLVTSRMPPRKLALVRIGIGVVVLIKAMDLVARLPEIAGEPSRTWLPAAPDLLSPVTAPAVLSLWIVAAFLLISGWYPRIGAALIALLCVVLAVGDVRLYNQHLYLLASMCAALALSECGRDLVFGRRLRHEDVPSWPAVLLMAQVSLVYGFGALAKLSVDFTSGAVLFAVFSRQPIAQLGGDWLLDAAVLVPLSLAAIGTELFLALAAWRRSLRGVVLAVAGPFHLGMVVVLALSPLEVVRLAAFGALQLTVLLVLFAPVDERSRVLVWDDSCGFCAGWVRTFRRMDWLHAMSAIPLSEPARYSDLGIDEVAAAHALQLREPDGSIHAGFEAVRRLAYVFPLTMLIAPWLALPPVRFVGDRTYRRIAARRTCAVVPQAAT